MTILKKLQVLFKKNNRPSKEIEQHNNFDEQFYLDHYQDVARANVNAYKHYVDFGKAEGRVPMPFITDKGSLPYYNEKDTVLLICHQASRTGAPILGLNLCQLLNNRYNVVVLLLERGEIFSFFIKNCFKIIAFDQISLVTPSRLDTIIQSISSKYNIQFALVNSIVGSPVLKPLGHFFIPSVLLVHEFFSYIRPISIFNDALLWAGATIFPTKMLQSNGTTDVTKHTIELSHVFPQGKSYIPFDKTHQTHQGNAQLKDLLYTLNKADIKPFIILGAGSVEYRKGVDLFIATAQEIKRSHPTANIKFFWVGHGFDPIHDAGYSCYLSHQIKCTELNTHFEFIPAVSDLEQLYQIANLFFFPARLDPLPNVIIDAMMLGLPILCFEHGCGASEILKLNKDTQTCILPYMNTHSAVTKIIELFESKSYYNIISQQISALAREHFDMQRYANKIIQIGTSLHSITGQEKTACDLIQKINLFPASNMLHFLKCSMSIRHYVRSWHSKIYPLRKPAPGFNPFIYNHHFSPTIEPFADYLSNGEQTGPWKNDLIIAQKEVIQSTHHMQVALHLHMPEFKTLSDILERLAGIKSHYDMFISTSAALQPHIEHLLTINNANNCFVTAVPEDTFTPNTLFHDFSPKLKTYDLIGHLCPLPVLNENYVMNNNARHLFFLEHMIGGVYPLMDQIIEEFKQNPSLGMVFPDDPYLWKNNLKQSQFNSPTAGMFWIRTKALEPLFLYGKETSDYDGITSALQKQQLHYATTHCEDITY